MLTSNKIANKYSEIQNKIDIFVVRDSSKLQVFRRKSSLMSPMHAFAEQMRKRYCQCALYGIIIEFVLVDLNFKC